MLFFSEYKITHQQANFECVDSVLTHCLLACCFKSSLTTIEQFLEYWKTRKSFFTVCLTKPTWYKELYLELVSSYTATYNRARKIQKIEKFL